MQSERISIPFFACQICCFLSKNTYIESKIYNIYNISPIFVAQKTIKSIRYAYH